MMLAARSTVLRDKILNRVVQCHKVKLHEYYSPETNIKFGG